MTEDEMVGWHHQLDGHEFEQTPGVGDGQGGLACCDSWGRKESDTTERLNGIVLIGIYRSLHLSPATTQKVGFILSLFCIGGKQDTEVNSPKLHN